MACRPSRLLGLEEDERIAFIRDAPGEGPVIGFIAREPDDIDVQRLTSVEVWDGPRFDVPAIALTAATVGEILLTVRARFPHGEPTAGAMHFHMAIGTVTPEAGPIGDYDTAIEHWRLALEAGESKALFGLGYTLVEAGRPHEAYDICAGTPSSPRTTPGPGAGWDRRARPLATWSRRERRSSARCSVRQTARSRPTPARYSRGCAG